MYMEPNFETNMTAAPVNNIMFYTCEAKEKLLSANTSSEVVNPTVAHKEKFSWQERKSCCSIIV